VGHRPGRPRLQRGAAATCIQLKAENHQNHAKFLRTIRTQRLLFLARLTSQHDSHLPRVLQLGDKVEHGLFPEPQLGSRSLCQASAWCGVEMEYEVVVTEKVGLFELGGEDGVEGYGDGFGGSGDHEDELGDTRRRGVCVSV
jgi:hypothetical protein